jgi:hypothetical protein
MEAMGVVLVLGEAVEWVLVLLWVSVLHQPGLLSQ